jgi:hypothetical protein
MEEGAQLPFKLELEPINYIEYQHLVMDLIYCTITCPNLSYSINHFAPLDSHMTTAKIILRYIKVTKDYGIFFPS